MSLPPLKAPGLDLNRDFIKLEAPESSALVRLLNVWDPHLTVDLHTTDGSYHGYHLTYSIPLNPSLNQKLLDYHRATLMPALTRAMRNGPFFAGYFRYFTLASRGAKHAGLAPGPLRVRMGLHTGTPLIGDEGYEPLTYFVDATGAPRTDNIVKVVGSVAGVVTLFAVIRKIVR